MNCSFMDNKIPHLNPAIGIKSKRFYNDPNNNTLTEAERETFDCSELLCGELLINGDKLL